MHHEEPLVSIVIPTWQRHDLLMETLRHIDKQTYDNKEVIVVIDGPDKKLVEELQYNYVLKYENNPLCNFELIVIELGRNWSGLDRSSFGIAPLLVGYLAASGKYIMPWCDDERALTNDHIMNLVEEIEKERINQYGVEYFADVVYPKVKIWRNGDPNGPETAIIGKTIPEHGQITHYLFRAENFVKFGYPDWGSHPVDWSLIKKWMRNGATTHFTGELTFEHRLDQ